jgi:glycosyltransferase involved in cell wall biosynthesis
LLAQTLDALLAQVGGQVEIVVVDGASTDNTAHVVGIRARQHGALKYFPQRSNSGVDRDYDHAIILARGRYCWLMSDDDLPADGAIARALTVCGNDWSAIIVDAEVYANDYSRRLRNRRLGFQGERRYRLEESDRLMAECGDCLSFIGALIIRRDLWLARERQSYFGTEFVHVGVLFQSPPLGPVVALGEPLLRIRYGVGNWASRAFDVWMVKWPTIIWSFGHISSLSRHQVTARFPWRNPVKLLLFRAKGWYTWHSFRQIVRPLPRPWVEKIPAFVVAVFPGFLAYLLTKATVSIFRNRYSGTRWELQFSPYASRKTGVPSRGT